MGFIDNWYKAPRDKEPQEAVLSNNNVLSRFPLLRDYFDETSTGQYNQRVCLSAPEIDTVVHFNVIGCLLFGYLTKDNQYVVFSFAYRELGKRVWSIKPHMIRVAKDLTNNAEHWDVSVVIDSSYRTVTLKRMGVVLEIKVVLETNVCIKGVLTVDGEDTPLTDQEKVLIHRIYIELQEEINNKEAEERRIKSMEYSLDLDAKIAKMFNEEYS